MWFDKDKIIEDSCGEDIGYALGLQIRGKQVLCPAHPTLQGRRDSNFGSAWFTPHGFTCRSCGRNFSTIDMVKYATGCSYQEALEYVAQHNPSSFESYIDHSKSDWSEMTPEQRKKSAENAKKGVKCLSAKEQSLIGLGQRGTSSFYTVAYSDQPKETAKKITHYDYNCDIHSEWLVESKVPVAIREYEINPDGFFIRVRERESDPDDFYSNTSENSSSLAGLYDTFYSEYLILVVTKSQETLRNMDSLIEKLQSNDSEENVNLLCAVEDMRRQVAKIFRSHKKELIATKKTG